MYPVNFLKIAHSFNQQKLVPRGHPMIADVNVSVACISNCTVCVRETSRWDHEDMEKTTKTMILASKYSHLKESEKVLEVLQK